MSRNNSIKIFIPLLVLVAISCSLSGTPAVITPSGVVTQQVLPPTSTVPANSICGWIENPSTTGVFAPIMTVSETGQVLQLRNLDFEATQKFNYVSPAYFRVYDPVYQAPDLLINFSSIEQVSSCPSAATQTSICGWIENTSTTGVMAPTMTVSETGQILQLWNLDVEAIGKLNYSSPAYFRVYDPVYQSPDLLINFSRVEQVSSCPSAVTQTSICGWIENSSTTGVFAPKMTVAGTGQVLQLWNLDVAAVQKFNYVSPAYFRVYDPVYQAPDLLINFSSIEQVSSCPSAQTTTLNPTQVAYVSGFAGTWDTNWGDMTCSVDGQMVNCTYTHDLGKIDAWLSSDGITMEGNWSESPSYQPPADAGRVTFTLSADGNSITGHWWYGQSEDGGSWTGTRK
jgi:hypothetical protein